MSQLLALDTRDDRAELRNLLDRLPPVERVRFLYECCKRVPQNEKGHLPAPVPNGFDEVVKAAYRCDAASDRLTRMVYADMLVLMSAFNADAMQMAVSLESFVRRHTRGR